MLYPRETSQRKYDMDLLEDPVLLQQLAGGVDLNEQSVS